jgi:hypothetical protein
MSLYTLPPQDARRALALGALAAKAKQARAEGEGAPSAEGHRERDAAFADVEAFARHAVIQTAEGEEAPLAEVGWPWQFQLLGIWSANKLCVVLKARQLGVSWLAAIFALWTALRRPGQLVLLISKGQDDAEKLLDKVAFVYSHLPAWKPRAVVNIRSIRFPDSGSEIEALPATENVGRSRTAALVILDEHAHQPWARKILLAVKAVAEKGRILSISSANGQGALHSQLYLAAKARTNGWQAVFIPARAHPDRVGNWRAEARAQLEQLSDAEFAQEYPQNDLEAIRTTGRPVFRMADLERQPVEAGQAGEQGIVLYREPQPGKVYIIGADVGEGLATSDWSSATVIERDSGEQVAHLRGRWAPDVFAAKIDRLARHYAPDASTANNVIVAVERNNHGHAVLLRLAQLHAGTAPYRIFRARDKRVGWLTTSATRPVLVDQLEEALRTAGIILHDAGTIDQFGAFAYNDEGRPEAQGGYHDDDVMAAGIAWQVRRRAFGRVLDVRHSEGRAA